MSRQVTYFLDGRMLVVGWDGPFDTWFAQLYEDRGLDGVTADHHGRRLVLVVVVACVYCGQPTYRPSVQCLDHPYNRLREGSS